MNIARYELEIVKRGEESLETYPSYIQDMMKDIFNFDNSFVYDIIELENILVTLDEQGNDTNKFAIKEFNNHIDEHISDDTLCITFIKPTEIKGKGISIARQYTILNMLGFVNVNMRFSLDNMVPMVYIRNSAGMEYFNTARFVVFDFLDNFNKVGGL